MMSRAVSVMTEWAGLRRGPWRGRRTHRLSHRANSVGSARRRGRVLAWHRAPGREGWLVTGLVAVRPLRPAPRQAVSSSPRRSLWRGQQACTPREVPRTPPALVQRGSRLLQCNEAASSPQSRAAQHARLAVRGRLPGAQAQSGTSRGAPQPSAVRASPSRLGRRGCETLARTRGASATSPVPSATGPLASASSRGPEPEWGR